MKTKTPSFLSQAASLLLITCATLASCLFSLGTSSAQNAGNSSLVKGNGSTWNNNSGLLVGNNSSNTLTFHNSYDEETHIVGENLVINTLLTINTLSFDADSTLTVDSSLTVKNISSDGPNAKMILCPNAVLDLGGSTLTVPSLTLADSTNFSIHDLNGQNATLITPFKLSNGATIINGTLIFDSTQPNALQLVETNEHRSDQAPGTVTLRKQN